MEDEVAQQRTIHTARNLIQATSGGWLMGALLGLSEAGLHAATAPAADAVAPAYAAVLYGVLGIPFGLCGGLAFTVYERMRDPGPSAEARALVAGAIATTWPLAGFAGRYLLNKIVYLERGVPLSGMAGLAVALLVVSALLWTVGVVLLDGPLQRLRTGPGSLGGWAILVAAGVAWAVVGAPPDPRASFDVGKPIPPALEDAPNILVIAVDTLRADALGTYGAEGDPSPAIDALAARGIVFEQAHTQASWTRSSFASLWTSRLPSSHNADTKAARLSEDATLVSEVLQDAGYATGNLVNNINVTATFGFDQGWDVFLYEAPDYVLGGTESVFSLTFYKVLHKLHEKLVTTKEVGRFYQPADVVLADARRFIEANADSRWMLVTHLMEPHDPYFRHPNLEGTGSAMFDGFAYGRAEHEHPDPADAEMLERLYRHEITHMDRRIAEFVAWLEQRGELGRTLIVLTADHGEEFGEHGGFWHGQTLYDEQTRVPLIVVDPRMDVEGVRVPWQVRSIDVAPTLAAAAGLRLQDKWAWLGTDLLKDVQDALSDRAAAVEQAEAARQAALEAASDTDADTDADTDDGEPIDPVPPAVDPAAPLFGDLTGCAAYLDPRNRVVVAEQDFEGVVLSSVRARGGKRIRASEGNARGLPTRQLFNIVTDPGEQDDLEGKDAVICDDAAALARETLDEALKEALSGASGSAIHGGEAEVDASETARMCALGYLSGPACEQ